MVRDSIWSCLDLHLEMEKTLRQTCFMEDTEMVDNEEPIWWPCHDEFGLALEDSIARYAGMRAKSIPKSRPYHTRMANVTTRLKIRARQSKTPKWRSSVPSNHVIRFTCFVLDLSLFHLQSSAGILVAPPKFGNESHTKSPNDFLKS